MSLWFYKVPYFNFILFPKLAYLACTAQTMIDYLLSKY